VDKVVERLKNGIIKENPTFVLMLGMCPTLAVTTSAINGLGMGLSTTIVLMLSNLMISLLRNIIPDRVRMPAFIVVVASFVTIIQFLVQGYVPSLYSALGIYIPLIVVNCIILGRAESYASKNPPLPSFFDGVGMGLGFTMSLTIIGAVREILGAGTLFDFQILPLADSATGKMGYTPISIFVLAPGAFFVLSILVAVMNVVRKNAEKKGRPLPEASGCLAGDCSGCAMSSGCTGHAPKAEAVSKTEVAPKADAAAKAATPDAPKAPEVASVKSETVETAQVAETATTEE